MELLPIGSIIEIENTKFAILGYDFTCDEFIRLRYVISFYPLGYVNKKSVSLIDIEYDFKVLFVGYKSDDYTMFADERIQLAKDLKSVNASEIEKVLDYINQTFGGVKYGQ